MHGLLGLSPDFQWSKIICSCFLGNNDTMPKNVKLYMNMAGEYGSANTTLYNICTYDCVFFKSSNKMSFFSYASKP